MTLSIYKKKQIVKKWFTWYSIRQIAKELKISRKTVRKYLILEGLIIRDQYGYWWYRRNRTTQYYRFYGDYNSNYDSHINLGKGNLPLKKIISMIPHSSSITIETEKNSEDNLDDFKQDILYLRSLIK